MDGVLHPTKQSQDQDAFEQMVRPFLGSLYHTALLITLNREAAEDAVQEGLIRAYASFRRFRGDKFKAWLYRIIINEAKRQRRNQWRRPITEELRTEALSSALTPEQNAVDSEQSKRLWQTVCDLSRDQRTVLVLRCFLEMSEAETAAVLKIPVGTVKSRLYHARKYVEQQLQKDSPANLPLERSSTARRPSNG